MTFLRHFLPALPLVILTAAHADGINAQLNFINGDRLTGTPGEINADGNLILAASEILDTPPHIRLSSLLDLRLEEAATHVGDASHEALLTLSNGDTIRGELNGLTDEHVTMKCWYGGILEIKRSMAKDIEILRAEKSILSGPGAKNDWTVYGDDNAWSIDNGQLSSSGEGGIARQVELPDKAHLSFNLAWRSNLKFRLLLSASEGDTNTPENCYDLVCQRRFVYLRKRWMTKRSGGSRTIGQPANIKALAEKEKVTLDFYLDRKAGTVAFYVDGVQAQIWTDDDPETGSFGKWIHFISEDYPLRISGVRASAWKGDLPEDPNAEATDEPLEKDGQVIRLQNGDDVVGEVGDITDGVLAIKTQHADIRIPVARMRTVDLTSESYEEPKRMKGDVRAWLHEGGRITFQLKSFSDGKLVGYSQNFGTSEFDLGAFSRLEFNIYNEDLEARRGGPNW